MYGVVIGLTDVSFESVKIVVMMNPLRSKMYFDSVKLVAFI